MPATVGNTQICEKYLFDFITKLHFVDRLGKLNLKWEILSYSAYNNFWANCPKMT
jgi:hypothetical protein